MEHGNELDLLSRLASKAKKKLSKMSDEDLEPRRFKATYEFKVSNISNDEKKLQKKIVQLLENNPDCDDPIGRLIDHKVFDNLSEERKQAYILKLSNSYQTICAKIKP